MPGDAQRRVPHVREVAMLDGFAVVRGYSAWFLHRLLRDLPGGIEAVLARSGVPPERRADVLLAYQALGEAGARWRLEHAASTSGSVSDRAAAARLLSNRDELAHRLLGCRDAAVALDLTDRQVRSLAASGQLRGRRDSGGRWLFDPADVAAERERRLMEGGRRAVA